MKVSETEPESPSLTLAGAVRRNGIGSLSSVMVPVPLPAVVDTVALVGLLSETTTVSSTSSVLSPVISTVIVLLVSPASKVSVPGVSV